MGGCGKALSSESEWSSVFKVSAPAPDKEVWAETLGRAHHERSSEWRQLD